MKKGGWGVSAVLSLGTIQRSFWGVRSICARSPGLLFPLSMPLGRFLLGWLHLVVITCTRASHYLCVFFLGASSLLECVLYLSLLLYVGVWHSVPSVVLVDFLLSQLWEGY